MAPKLDAKLRAEYERLWETCTIIPKKAGEVMRIIEKMVNQRASYQAPGNVCKVPWFLVGVIHAMEADCDLRKHLHNGDPLTKRTVRVPAGRPKVGMPPFTFFASAVDALGYDGLTGWQDWSISGILYKLEGYNGWGYRNRAATRGPSDYLWSYSNHDWPGRFIADGTYSPSAKPGQPGVAVILRRMQELGIISIPMHSSSVKGGADVREGTGTLPGGSQGANPDRGGLGGVSRPVGTVPSVLPPLVSGATPGMDDTDRRHLEGGGTGSGPLGESDRSGGQRPEVRPSAPGDASNATGAGDADQRSAPAVPSTTNAGGSKVKTLKEQIEEIQARGPQREADDKVMGEAFLAVLEHGPHGQGRQGDPGVRLKYKTSMTVYFYEDEAPNGDVYAMSNNMAKTQGVFAASKVTYVYNGKHGREGEEGIRTRAGGEGIVHLGKLIKVVLPLVGGPVGSIVADVLDGDKVDVDQVNRILRDKLK